MYIAEVTTLTAVINLKCGNKPLTKYNIQEHSTMLTDYCIGSPRE